MQEVEDQLKASATHQFTIDQVSNVLCVCVNFTRPRGTLYFLFAAGRLARIIEPPPIEWESKSFHGKSWKVPKAFEAEHKVQSTLMQNDLTPEQISVRLKMWAEAEQQKGHEEPGNISPAFILTAPLWASKSKEFGESLAKAKELSSRFNPLKIRLGMTLDEVKEYFGHPMKSVDGKGGSKTFIFGADLPQYTPANFPHVWVSVTIKDGKVDAVYSHDYFDKRLLSN